MSVAPHEQAISEKSPTIFGQNEFSVEPTKEDLAKNERKIRARRVCVWLLTFIPSYLQNHYFDAQANKFDISYASARVDQFFMTIKRIIPCLTSIVAGANSETDWDTLAQEIRQLHVSGELRHADSIISFHNLDSLSFDLEIGLYFHDIYSHSLGLIISLVETIQDLEAEGDDVTREDVLAVFEAEVPNEVARVILRSVEMMAEITEKPTSTALVDVVKAVFRFTSSLDYQYNLDVRVKNAIRLDFSSMKIDLSRHQLSSYLENFLSNAHKAYGEVKGRVDVLLEVREHGNTPEFVMRFIDLAGGFPESRLTSTRCAVGELDLTQTQIVSGSSLWGDGRDQQKHGLGISLSAIKQQVESQFLGTFLAGNVTIDGKTGACIFVALPVSAANKPTVN